MRANTFIGQVIAVLSPRASVFEPDSAESQKSSAEAPDATEPLVGRHAAPQLQQTPEANASGIADMPSNEEPRLPVLAGPPAFFSRPRLLVLFVLPTLVAVVGAALLLITGTLLLPFEPIVTLKGKAGSEKAAFFEDEQVKKILMKNHIQVIITPSGSRDIATHDVDDFDFVFPSGRPTAIEIVSARQRANKYYTEHRPFISPIVLATYRPYAEALKDRGVAIPQAGADPGNPLYYDLNIEKFLSLVQEGRTWNDIGIHNTKNGNKVLAQTSDICSSNAAATYLALVAFAVHGSQVAREDEAKNVAMQIKPLLTEQGLPEAATADRFTLYLTPDGSGNAPIIVVYEHQYLAYQVHKADSGRPDPSRVLLYPAAHLLTQPEFIALTRSATRLGQLVTNDPALLHRAMELGFRVLDPSGATSSERLSEFLRQMSVPPPSMTADDTKTFLPALPLLEKMIEIVGDCPPPK